MENCELELFESLTETIKKVLKEELTDMNTLKQRYIKGIDGLAQFLGISKSVAQKMKNEGVVPYVQYDRVVLFDPDEV